MNVRVSPYVVYRRGRLPFTFFEVRFTPAGHEFRCSQTRFLSLGLCRGFDYAADS